MYVIQIGPDKTPARQQLAGGLIEHLNFIFQPNPSVLDPILPILLHLPAHSRRR